MRASGSSPGSASITAKAGRDVEAGALLFQLDAKPLLAQEATARTEIAAAGARVTQAKRGAARFAQQFLAAPDRELPMLFRMPDLRGLGTSRVPLEFLPWSWSRRTSGRVTHLCLGSQGPLRLAVATGVTVPLTFVMRVQ
jgi:hypothetical protein